jgi:hypothetical protein
MRGRQRGSFITLDAAPALSIMMVNGKPVTMRPPLTEAERDAEEKRDFNDIIWRVGTR